MDEKTYVQLYGILRPLIEKETTQMREPISAHERLTATGAKYMELQYMTCISPQALCKIIPETCCAIYQALSKDYLKIPEPSKINDLPYVFVADEAFALRPDFLKPFNVRVLNDQKRIFNYRLSRARRVIENVFGSLVSRFGSFPISNPSQSLKTTRQGTFPMWHVCGLTQFLTRNASQSYSPPEHLDHEEPVSHEMQDGLRTDSPHVANIAHGQNRNATEEAKFVRDQFMVYFNTNGKVPWQDAYA
ncbi:hypothetical protein RRG08_067148 [Elysia crispata]|uniref:DDE Tnp4 domain-containing protein n=1 Tax=Elysia crispata TaxID=231223 RepID=A0AAE0YLE8_9GAST|nr:hypothetical protein RRG08_067148 [Elysia crispata]